MSLSIRDYTVQASHHQGDVSYSASRAIEYSCMSLISVSRTLFKYPGLWNKADLDCIFGNGISYLNLLAKLDILGWKIWHKSS